MGYNSNCISQSCSNNCCNYYGYCTSSYSSYSYSSSYYSCYYYYNSNSSTSSASTSIDWIYYVIAFGIAGLSLLIGLCCYCYRRQRNLEIGILANQASHLDLGNDNPTTTVVLEQNTGVNYGVSSYPQAVVTQPYTQPYTQPQVVYDVNMGNNQPNYGQPNYGQPNYGY